MPQQTSAVIGCVTWNQVNDLNSMSVCLLVGLCVPLES